MWTHSNLAPRVTFRKNPHPVWHPELVDKFDNFVETGRFFSTSLSGFSRNDSTSISPSLSSAVVLKNSPKDVTDAAARKEYLKKHSGSDAASIIKLKPRKFLFAVIVGSCNATNYLAQAISTSDSSLSAKVKSTAYYGVVRRLPAGFCSEDVCVKVENCVLAVKIGKILLI